MAEIEMVGDITFTLQEQDLNDAAQNGGERMSKPVIAANKPIKVALKQGEEYYFCACGRSSNQPFCDGSHKGTGLKPKRFVAEESGDAYLCRCKHTQNPPYCDGTHKQFSNEQVGQEGPGVQTQSPASAPVASATKEEPTVELIHQLAREGLSQIGHHGPMTAMGVPRHLLPHWDDIQIMVAQMATQPLLEDVPVKTELVIGPQAKKPLKLSIPLFVSDMSFGSLSEEAKIALATGAELAERGYAPVKAACCLKSRRLTHATFMSSPAPSLATTKRS